MLRIKEISQNQGFHIAVSRKHVGHIGGVSGVQIAQIKGFNLITLRFSHGKQFAAIRRSIHLRIKIILRCNEYYPFSLRIGTQITPDPTRTFLLNVAIGSQTRRHGTFLAQVHLVNVTISSHNILQLGLQLALVEDVVIRGELRGEVTLLLRLVNAGKGLVGRLGRIERRTVAADQHTIGTARKHVLRGISRNERCTTPFAWVVIIYHLIKNKFLAGVNGCQFLAIAEHAPCIHDM